jgi:hypothetical protein
MRNRLLTAINQHAGFTFAPTHMCVRLAILLHNLVLTIVNATLPTQVVVLLVVTFHVILSWWFLYTCIFKFRGLPDPGWFPNVSLIHHLGCFSNCAYFCHGSLQVVGISYAAVKMWTYFPRIGLMLMMVSGYRIFASLGNITFFLMEQASPFGCAVMYCILSWHILHQVTMGGF